MKKKGIVFLLIVLIALLPVCTALAGYRVNTTWLKDRLEKRAYVQSKYLSKSSSYTAYVSKDNTVVHTGPAISFKSLGKLGKGAKVKVLSHGSAFDYVSTSKGKGYIRNTHLTSSKPGTGSKAKSGSKNAHIKNPRNRTVNLRTGPGKKYKVVAEYRPGTKVTLLQRGSAWCKVKVGGRTGYIMRKYIAVD